MYVGSTVNLSKRWSRHRQELHDGIHRNKHLQSAWIKYGQDAFEWRILELCTVADRIEREQSYIDRYCLTDPARGFNKASQAGVSYGGVGRTWTPEQRAEASRAWKERRPSGWTPQGITDTSIGSKCSEGHVRDGSYMKKRKNGSLKLLCQECERFKARARARRKAGIPDDWPSGKHFNQRGR